MSGAITSVPVDCLVESPFNPRKSYPEDELQELALSIGSQGMLQPIVARTVRLATVEQAARFEIVFGHRRYRAASLAGMAAVPVILRDDMTDEQAAVAQVHENLKRKDVTALEEADSFHHLRRAHQMSADSIAAAVGKSRSYVYGRLKLSTGAPELRFAVLNQGLSPETGLEIARLPHHDMQRAALKQIRLPFQESAEQPIVWMSVRDAAARLRRMFDLDTADAPWDVNDAGLIVIAGACTTCPYRAANDPALQGVLGDNICLREPCYRSKEAAHQQRELDALRAAGCRVIDGSDANDIMPTRWAMPRGYVALDRNAYGATTFAEAIKQAGGAAPPLTVIAHPERVGELAKFITVDQAKAMLATLGEAVVGKSAGVPGRAVSGALDGGEDDVEEPDARSPEVRAVTDEGSWLRLRRKMLAQARVQPRTVDELRDVLLRELDGREQFGALTEELFGWAEAEEEDDPALFRENKIRAMSADDLAALLVLAALDDAGRFWSWNGRMMQQAAERRLAQLQRYGINPLADSNDDESVDGPQRDPNTGDLFEQN